MGNKIQTTYSKGDSHWISAVPRGPYTQEMNFPDVDKPELVAEALLTEFNLSDEKDKERFRKILTTWMEGMPTNFLDRTESAKVRDFIYEMF